MRISSITKNAGKACNNRLYRHIRTFKKIVKNYFVILKKYAIIKEIKQKAGGADAAERMKCQPFELDVVNANGGKRNKESKQTFSRWEKVFSIAEERKKKGRRT